MEILLAVVLTIMVIGLGISIFLNLLTIGTVQRENEKVEKLSDKQDVLLRNQHQIAQLLSNMTFSINGLALTIEDLMALSEGYGFPTDMGMGGMSQGPTPGIPWQERSSEFDMTYSEGMEHTPNPSLSDDEIKFLRNLLRKDEESEEDD